MKSLAVRRAGSPPTSTLHHSHVLRPRDPTGWCVLLMQTQSPPPRCVWCQTTVHDDCMDTLAEQRCNLGEFQHLIIPPHYLHRVNKLRRRHPDEYSKVGPEGGASGGAGLGPAFTAALVCLCSWRRPAGAAGRRSWSWPTLVAATTWGRCFWGSSAPSSTRSRSVQNFLFLC